MALNRIKGFPEYNHPQAAMTCDGRTLAQVQAVFTTVDNANLVDFHPDYGWKLQRNDAVNFMRFEWLGYINAADRLQEGTITYWIDAKAFANTAYDNGSLNRVLNYILTNGSYPHWRLASENDGSIAMGGIVGDSPNANSCLNMEGFIPFDNTGEPVFVRVDVSLNRAEFFAHIEGIPFMRGVIDNSNLGTATDQKFFKGFMWGGNSYLTATTTPEIYTKDCQFVPQAIDLKYHPIYRRFALLSDSFGKYFAYDGNAGNHHLRGNFTDHFGGGEDVATTIHGLSRGLPVLHGQLNLAGCSPLGGRIENYSVGGGLIGIDGTKTADTMLEAMLNNGIIQTGANAGIDVSNAENGYGTTSPDVIFAVFGANNVTGANVLGYQAMYDGWNTLIGEAVAAGCKRFIASECAPTAKEGGDFANAQAEANILTFNSALHDVAATYPQAFVCKVYDRFGGQSNFKPEDWAGDRHPATYGMVKWARWLFETFIDSI